MKKIISFGFLTTVFIASALPLFAKTAKPEADSVKYRFNPVVVTATKAAGAQKDLAASVSVVDAKAIQNAVSNSVLELVKDRVPGVFITERAVMGYGVAAGAAGGISIRGIGGSPTTGVLVLRDGRPDIMGMMGHPIPDAYSLDGVERIEVVRGPASFLYGTNAMGGVINIVSKKMTENGFHTKLSGGIGTFNSRKLALYHGGKLGSFEYYLTASTNQTDGHREFSNYDGDFYTAHFGYAVNPSTKISFNANLANLYLLDPGPVTAPVGDHWYDLRRSGVDLTLTHSGRLGESYFRLHGNFGRHKIYDGWRSNDRTVGFMFYHNVKPWGGNITTIGFDIKRYGGDAEDTIHKIPVINYGREFITEYAPYIHTQQLFLTRFIASAGIRVEHHPLYGSEAVPKFGLVTHVAKTTSLRLSAAKGFRSPAIRELYVFPPKNEKLLPEQMWNYEIGLSQNIGRTAQFEASLFRANGDNMIRLMPPPPRPMFVNSGIFRHTGYELTFQYSPFHNFDFSSSWTKLDLGNETLNAPGKKLTAFLSYRYGKTSLGINLVHIRDLYGADFRKNKMGNYTLVNLSLDVNVLKSIGFRLAVKNALDEKYQTLYNYPMPGRMLVFDANYTL